MNTQRRYRILELVNMETEAEHSTNSYSGITNTKTSTDEEASSELSEGYDAEYSDEDGCKAWHKGFRDSDYNETVRDHDDIAREN